VRGPGGPGRRPAPSSEAARSRMRSQRRAGTGPELALRQALWRRGLRYRVDAAVPVPGVRRRADLLFSGPRVAVFVDGCFWHACPEHGTAPRANAWYWGPKLVRNAERDRDTDRRLAEAGWAVVRVWEHEDADAAAAVVEAVVRGRAKPARGRGAGPTRSPTAAGLGEALGRS